MRKKDIRLLLGFIAGVLVMFGAFLKTSSQTNSQPAENYTASSTTQIGQAGSGTNAFIKKVVDGDTVIAVLDSEPGREFKVRLLGINTPETVDPRRPVECFGKQASDFAKKLLQDKRVFLEADPEADEIDKYGRLLRNIYLADKTNVNALMVEQGFANAYLQFPLNQERKNQLRDLEAQAKQAERGLWSPDTCSAN